MQQTKTKTNVVLGVDPGIANCGMAVVQANDHRYRLLETVIVSTTARIENGARLDEIYNAFCQLCDKHLLTAVAIERVYHNRNISSSIATGKVIGLLEWTAYHCELPVYLITPQAVKSSSGLSAKADKKHLVKQAGRMFGTLLTHHESDAAFCAIAGLLKHRDPRT